MELRYLKLYGFEDHRMMTFDSRIFSSTPYSGYIVNYEYTGSGTLFFCNKDITKGMYKYEFTHPLYCDHPELLDTAKKVYVHSSCKISRSMMAEKYKKAVNPWVADAVVVPEYDDGDVNIPFMAVFINSSAKICAVVQMSEESDIERFSSLPIGTEFRSLVDCNYVQDDSWDDVCEATLEYAGRIIHVQANSILYDIMTNGFPVDKTVYEKTVQDSLGTEDNKMTLDALISIKEMINSSDKDSQGAAMKALSLMDFMHYPNSVKYVLMHCNDSFRYNKAANSTSFKYMMQYLCGYSRRRWWPGSYNDNISQEDYELFKQLVCYDHKCDEKGFYSYVKYINFIRIDDTGHLTPILK